MALTGPGGVESQLEHFWLKLKRLRKTSYLRLGFGRQTQFKPALGRPDAVLRL